MHEAKGVFPGHFLTCSSIDQKPKLDKEKKIQET